MWKERKMNMFYAPEKSETGTMWDTWLFWHDGMYYLYYLARSGEKWDNTSLATSTDGVHWNEIGPIYRMSEGTTWMGTGSTWKAPISGQSAFQINYSEWHMERQTIFFAESDDLVHWTKSDPSTQFIHDERWYEPLGRWDCIWTVPCDEGGLYGYWTATPKFGTKGRFGFGRSNDGITWKALPPPVVQGVDEGEVGAIEKIDSRYYMMFGSHGEMVTLVSDTPEGPFRVARKNPTLLSGDTYFARFFSTPDGLLVNHHSIVKGDSSRIFLGLLKRVYVDDEGTMRLGWWEGNNRLKADLTEHTIQTIVDGPSPIQYLDSGTLGCVAGGVIIEGEVVLPPDAFSPGRGIFIEFEPGNGVAALFDSQGRADLSIMKEDGTGCHAKSRVDREKLFCAPAIWRLVLEDRLCELYLDDILVQCVTLPAPATGRIGLVNGGLVRGGVPNDVRALGMWK